jgi:hypothetical protein
MPGSNFDKVTVAQMAEKNPELLMPFVERFFKERVEPALSAGIEQTWGRAADVQAFLATGQSATVPTE